MAVNKNEIFNCVHCKNLIQIISGVGPIPTCCGEEMVLQSENTVDAATEKHVPIVGKTSDGYRVAVGEVDHPMEYEHLIRYIELIEEGTIQRKLLEPGDPPVAEFKTDSKEVVARSYCNLHGLWKN